jgi:hypothetical protein
MGTRLNLGETLFRLGGTQLWLLGDLLHAPVLDNSLILYFVGSFTKRNVVNQEGAVIRVSAVRGVKNGYEMK